MANNQKIPDRWIRMMEGVRAALHHDTRHERYREEPNVLRGHSYVAAEALYHLLGGADAGWRPRSINHEGQAHWFLRHNTGVDLDPTGSQFTEPPDYSRSASRSFLTEEPSRPASIVIDRVPQNLKKFEPMEKGVMQRIAPFNPQKDRMDGIGETFSAIWQGADREQEHRDLIPHMDGTARTRALHKLAGSTKVRVNEKGEREFLLHRGVSPEEYAASRRGHTVNHDQSSSWTPRYHTASLFAERGPTQNKHVLSAWIPESFIRNVPMQFGALDPAAEENEFDEQWSPPKGANKYGNEHEVVVDPDHNSRVATEADLAGLADSRETLHGRINQAGRAIWTEPKDTKARLRGRVAKSEDLSKAISDIKPGRVMIRNPANGNTQLDFSHLLKPQHVGMGYQLFVHDEPNTGHIDAELKHRGSTIGFIHGNKAIKNYCLGHSDIDQDHQGQGLGTAMYEAVLAHALHRGLTHVVGEHHSSMASRVHQKLAQKHGLGYIARPNLTLKQVRQAEDPLKAWEALPDTDYDAKYNEYKYMIKHESDPRAVALILKRPDGFFLMGKRRDSGKWTCPGGHIEPGEHHSAAAIREAVEESGLIPEVIRHVGSGNGGPDGSVPLFVYRAIVRGEPTNGGDPDHEFQEFRWLSMYEALPQDIAQNLHHPNDIALRTLGMQTGLRLTNDPQDAIK